MKRIIEKPQLLERECKYAVIPTVRQIDNYAGSPGESLQRYERKRKPEQTIILVIVADGSFLIIE